MATITITLTHAERMVLRRALVESFVVVRNLSHCPDYAEDCEAEMNKIRALWTRFNFGNSTCGLGS